MPFSNLAVTDPQRGTDLQFLQASTRARAPAYGVQEVQELVRISLPNVVWQ